MKILNHTTLLAVDVGNARCHDKQTIFYKGSLIHIFLAYPQMIPFQPLDTLMQTSMCTLTLTVQGHCFVHTMLCRVPCFRDQRSHYFRVFAPHPIHNPTSGQAMERSLSHPHHRFCYRRRPYSDHLVRERGIRHLITPFKIKHGCRQSFRNEITTYISVPRQFRQSKQDVRACRVK